MGKPHLRILLSPRKFCTDSVVIEPVKTDLPEIISFNSSELDRIHPIDTRRGNSVYKVINRNTGQPFALKVMPVSDEPAVRRQIFREVQIMMNLNHPNIVKCHGSVEEEGDIQVLLEFVNGMSLAGAHITDESRLSDICRQALTAIAYVHSRRIALRNIKPSNILINEQDDQVKISDFGLISRIFRKDPLGDSVRTIAYMGPERINSDECIVWGPYNGLKDDIWGFGLSVLEVYLGRYPFEVEREGDWKCLSDAICGQSSPPAAPESASRRFRDFIGCCLQKNPAMRWSSQQLLEHPFVQQQQLV